VWDSHNVGHVSDVGLEDLGDRVEVRGAGGGATRSVNSVLRLRQDYAQASSTGRRLANPASMSCQ
jgi:hypothetical protein